MNEQFDLNSPDFLACLGALGLSITRQDHAPYAWGYTWRRHTWIGPYETPEEAVQNAFNHAIRTVEAVHDLPWGRAAGELWRWTGQAWESITGPRADEEEREAFTTLNTLLESLNHLRSTETHDLTIPGPAEQWRKALDAGEQAYGELEAMMQDWQEELADQYHRGVNADEALDDEEEEGDEEEGDEAEEGF